MVEINKGNFTGALTLYEILVYLHTDTQFEIVLKHKKDRRYMVDYQYYAFISYKREDEKWAKWIQRSLETYRLPAKIRKDFHIAPKKLSPVFRDKTDLGAGVLSDNLRDALKASKYLIVICSPKSSHSTWVETEIREFVKIGRKSRIIPLIVEGTPNTNDDKECLNKAIKEISPELLGVSIYELGRNQSLVKIVARLLDLQFDELWKREHRRQRQRKIRKYSIISSIVIMLSMFSYYFGPKYEYYADIVEFGDGCYPIGIGKLTREEVKHRNEVYVFFYSMRKLQQVAVCNSARRQVGRFDYYVDPIQYGSPNYYNEIYRYRADGSIECVLAVGKNDVSGVDVKDGSYTMHSGRFEVDGELTEIRRLKLSRDTNGFVTRIEYKKYNGEDGVGVANQCGVYGEDRALDNDGRVISVRFVDKDGNVGMIDDYGVYEIKNDYDEKGQIVSIMYLDKNGDLVNGSEGLALAIFTYDQYGNVLSFRTYDQYSNPMVNRFGISGCDNQYDDKGNKVECLFLGDDFLPFTTSECETCRVRQEFDKYGNVIRTLYCDMDGNPCRNLDGYASVLWTFNKYGRVMSCEFFDEDGHRTENVYGYAKAVNVYDKQLNLIEISYFGTDGCPCLDNRGISKETVSDNLNTKMGELLYFGIDGRPCLNKEGIAGMQIEYGDRRVIRKVTMLGVNREYVVDKQGIQSILYEYDTHGSLHTIMNVSSDGRLQDDIYGAAFYEILNDSDGYALQVKGYNENGDTVSAPDLGKLFVRQLVSYKHERF